MMFVYQDWEIGSDREDAADDANADLDSSIKDLEFKLSHDLSQMQVKNTVGWDHSWTKKRRGWDLTRLTFVVFLNCELK